MTGDDRAGQRDPDEHPPAFMLAEREQEYPPHGAGPDENPPGLSIANWSLKARRLREDMFGPGLFADPAWDILLDLYVAEAKGARVQVTSLALAARVPHSTAIRWAGIMTRAGLLDRQRDPADARRIHVSLSPRARRLMEEYLGKLSREGQTPVLAQARQSP